MVPWALHSRIIIIDCFLCSIINSPHTCYFSFSFLSHPVGLSLCLFSSTLSLLTCSASVHHKCKASQLKAIKAMFKNCTRAVHFALAFPFSGMRPISFSIQNSTIIKKILILCHHEIQVQGWKFPSPLPDGFLIGDADSVYALLRLKSHIIHCKMLRQEEKKKTGIIKTISNPHFKDIFHQEILFYAFIWMP